MIKQLKVLLAAVAMLFVLAACNSESASNLTEAEDVLKQSLEAMEELNSYSMKMESEQTMNMNGEEEITMFMTIDADMMVDPMAFYQNLSMESDIPMMGAFETEMYLVDDTIYVFEPMMDEWMELPMEMAEELGGLAEMQLSPDQQLAMLRNFVDDIEMTENNNEYILKLAGEGTDFMEIAQVFGGVGTEGFDEMLEMFSQLDLNFVEYEIFIDKETLYQTKLNMTMDMTMGMDGETVRTVQLMNATITGYNEIEEIVLPEGL
ncbi:hypothetical protein BKP35_05810 [Anaerobacillus arseniciselenatis]|uniref:Lipoprotein n=1 Tax=Anaerobacillus arseniciselenatis TaxID=85682 RepID=A0A1S2LQD9_9BACI|nr:DUF6612 family protein [Anaerobacillus arseniciselenatis]OIJ14729.1 hypothetical protein BKP35_05810 [Anaerobacillus arseniciselenatis]